MPIITSPEDRGGVSSPGYEEVRPNSGIRAGEEEGGETEEPRV